MRDTIELLKECNAGVKMGVDSINDMLPHIESSELEKILKSSSEEHSKIGSEVHILLNEYDEEGKEPNPMAKGMSWIKTNFKLTTNESDQTVADLVTDGCNMGIKSLHKYMNEYAAANERSRELTERLIDIEEDLRAKVVSFL